MESYEANMKKSKGKGQINNSIRKHQSGNGSTGNRQRVDSGGVRGSSNVKGMFQQNKHLPGGNGHQHFVNGNNTTKGHFGVVYGQSNGNLGNSNLAALFNGLVAENSNSKKVVEGGRRQAGSNNPQASHEELTKKLNMESLLRIDPSLTHLHGCASHVAVYDLDPVTNFWSETTTVGCLFIYSRSAQPEFGLVVLNRKGLKNLVTFFDKHSQVIPNEPFLHFRRGPEEAIKCIWFYKNSEFYATTELLRSLGIHFDQDEVSNGEYQASGRSTGPGNNLFDMLKKSTAKLEDDSSETKRAVMTAEQLEQQMYNDAEETPLASVLTSTTAFSNKTCVVENMDSGERQKSVMITESGMSLLKKFSLMPAKNPLVTERELEEKTRESEGSLSPRLNDASRSMKTVEQLEKDLVPDGNKLCAVLSRKKNNSTQDISTELLATLGIKPVKQSSLVSGSKGSAPASTSDDYSPKSPFMTPASRSRSNSVRSGKKLTIDDLDGKLYDETDEEMVREVVENLSDLTELLLLSENVDGQSEPQLVWRKRSNLQNRPASALIKMTPNHCTSSHHSSPRPSETSGPEISPLTRNQLLQAMTYLLQTDSNFVTTIHEAYVKSLHPSWSHRHLSS